MNKRKIDILSKYYQSELDYLRQAGTEFAKKYPKIAKKLDISKGESSNPQVERLLESFAFLCGKLQKRIDDQFLDVASNIINIVYPPLMRPTPSLVMVNFDVDINRCLKSAGTVIKKGTQLIAKCQGADPVEIYFSTCSDLPLWPLKICETNVITRGDVFINKNHIINTNESIYYLKLDLKWFGGDQIPSPADIKFFINGDPIFKGNMLSSLLINDDFCILEMNNEFKNIGSILPIGITEKESLFPYPNSMFKGFRLLHEYFAFPDKFYGFALNLHNNKLIANNFSIYIPLGKYIELPKTDNIFSLHTVPAVNLFKKTTEPLRLTHEQIDYDLVPDARRLNYTEIFSIERVYKIDQISNEKEEIIPYFAPGNLSVNDLNDQTFWYVKRVPGNKGDNIKISFVDNSFDFKYPANQIFFADTLCTNRYTAELIPAYATLQTEISLPVEKIYCLERPTSQKIFLKNSDALWKVISMFSLNSISFVENGLEKLKDILSIFSDGLNSNLYSEIEAIENFTCRNVSMLNKNSEWKGFVRGNRINIEFDSSLLNSGIPLSLILSNFFSVYCSINTYTELTTSINGKVRKVWPINLGLQNYL